jgi:hypothetical protein
LTWQGYLIKKEDRQSGDASWYYWELVVVSRKIAIIIISVFFLGNPQIQALLALLLVVVYIVLHVFAKV